MDKGKSHPANIATLQVWGWMPAPTVESAACIVLPYRFCGNGNNYVLPSEKMACLQKGIAKTVSPEKLRQFKTDFFFVPIADGVQRFVPPASH
jgi:hypothetical protein